MSVSDDGEVESVNLDGDEDSLLEDTTEDDKGIIVFVHQFDFFWVTRLENLLCLQKVQHQ